MIAIAFALEYESVCFRARHDQRLCVGVWLLGEVGQRAAVNLERMLAQSTPRLLISAGFAGGLQHDLKVGDLILGENYSAPEIVSKLALDKGWHVGSIVTAPAILERAEEKKLLGLRTGCLAGDLETAHLAKTCEQRCVPMLSVRCISDGVEDDLPVPADVLVNPHTGRPDPFGLFRHLIGHPSSITGFNQLLKNAKAAQNQLANGLEGILRQVLTIV